MNDVIRAKLKEIIQLQDITKKGYLIYKSNGRTKKLGKYSLPIVFLKLKLKLKKFKKGATNNRTSSRTITRSSNKIKRGNIN